MGNSLLADDFYVTEPIPDEQKEGAAEGGHPGIKRADCGKTPTNQTSDEMANPESHPSQYDIKE